MKTLTIIIITVLSISILKAQDTKTINGRILNEDLEPIENAIIQNIDSVELGSTDINGYFQIEVPFELTELLIGYPAIEWTSVKFNDSCENLEIIMMVEVIYDYLTIKKINRKRYKRYKNLPKIHLKAFDLDLFVSSKPCVSYIFKKY